MVHKLVTFSQISADDQLVTFLQGEIKLFLELFMSLTSIFYFQKP